MEIKFGGKWYKVVETREVAGLTHYAIEDEPTHIDWITNPKVIRYDDEINSCPEFPFFGATYPDARCIDGNLYDLDDCDYVGNLYDYGDYNPCPFCRKNEFIELHGVDTYNAVIQWTKRHYPDFECELEPIKDNEDGN